MAFVGLGVTLVGLFFCCLKVPVLMLLSLPMALVGTLLSVMNLRKEKSKFTIISLDICAIVAIYIAVIWVVGIGNIMAYFATLK